MLYKLSIKPTRLELLKLISLDKSRYKEIRVAVRPLPFRFNRGIIDSDDFFQQFVDIVNDFLETYRQDITELFVSLKENYFQVYEIGMQEYNAELLHWEIVQYLTDDFSNYKFGSLYVADTQKVHIVIARTKLIDYFSKVFKSIYGTINFKAIGFDLKSTKTETIFIKTDQDIVDYYRFGYSSSWNPENDIVAPKKSYTKYLISLAAVASVILIIVMIDMFSASKGNISSSSSTQKAQSKTDSLITHQPQTNEAKILPQDSVHKNVLESNKAVDKNALINTDTTTDVYQLLKTVIIANFKSLTINKNYGIIEYSNYNDANQSLSQLKPLSLLKNLQIVGKSNNIISFNLSKTDFYQIEANNKSIFDRLSNKFKLSDKYNYRIFSNTTDLSPFINELQKNKLQFSHLVISHRGNIFSLAIDFN